MSSVAVIDSENGDGRTAVADGAVARVSYAELSTLFQMNYPAICREHSAIDKPGLLSIALDLGSASVVGKHWLKTRPNAINAMVVGRHRACDLCLPRDPTISLRHLVVLAHPYLPGESERVSLRVLDLRTSLAFTDCFGHRLQAVIADGAAMLAVGRYALLLLPTGDGSALPRSPDSGWNVVADPVYLDQATQVSLMSGITELGGERRGPAAGAQLPAPFDDDGAQRTSLSIIDGPARASAGLLARGEEPLGTLEVSAEGQTHALAIGAGAAKQGLLLGGYDRCDDERLAHLRHAAISRVHLMLWLHKDVLYAVDTASTNGTFVRQQDKRVRARMVRMSDALELELADDRARLRWRAV